MLRIRLSRTGRRNQPKFRVVVAEKSRSIKGKFIEILGYYIPTGEKIFHVNKEAILKWIARGAHPSNTVATLLKKKASVDEMDKFIVRSMNKKRRRKNEVDKSDEKIENPSKKT